MLEKKRPSPWGCKCPLSSTKGGNFLEPDPDDKFPVCKLNSDPERTIVSWGHHTFQDAWRTSLQAILEIEGHQDLGMTL